ncbi:MAG: hypothetical protein IV085_12790 [Thiobacillus sp.]|nr:hypothetical protein [Thiobacillus sp.]
MSRSLRTASWFVGVLVGSIDRLALALVVFFDASVLKPRLEARVSEGLGRVAKVGVRVSVRFSPGLQITLEDVQIRN